MSAEPSWREEVLVDLDALLLAAGGGDALDAPERAEFEAHLDGCARCRAELRSYPGMLEALGESRDDAAAGSDPGVPEGLAARIRAEVSRTAQEPVPAARHRDAGVTPLDVERARRPPVLPRLLAVAAALVLIAAVGIGFALQRGGGDLASDFDRIRLAADREDLPLTVGDATVWISRAVGGEEEDGIAIDGTLPGLPDDQSYQVWVVPADGSAPRPGPVLRPSPDGAYAASWLTSLDGAGAIAISIEPWDPARPEEGSTAPTEVVDAVTLA